MRAGDYHVEWREPNGRLVRGAPVPFERLPVTMDDRMGYVRHFLQNSNIGGRGEEAVLSAAPAEMLEEKSIREMATRNSFAATRRPFTDSRPSLGLTERSGWSDRRG